MKRLALAWAMALFVSPALADYSPGEYDSVTDKGGTITVGGTAQTAIAANRSRKAAWCQNPSSATEDLFVASAGIATTSGAMDLYDLEPGQGNWIPGTFAVSVNAATTSHRFLCTEFQ